MVDQKALHDDGHAARSQVAPACPDAVDGAKHEEVGEADLSEDVSPCWHIDLDWEGRSLVHRVNVLGAGSGPEDT